MAKRVLYLGLDPAHYPTEGEVVHLPLIQIVPRPLSDPSIHAALTRFENYSHILVTSKSTIPILHAYLGELGIDLTIWKSKLTLAVGQVTAQHLKIWGITPFRIAQEETAEGMINELKQLSLKEGHLFWPHSSQARTLIDDFLIAQKIHHTSCLLYDTQTRIPENIPSLAPFDEIVFTSPSTVKAFLSIYGEMPTHARLTPIGPVTANFLTDLIRKP